MNMNIELHTFSELSGAQQWQFAQSISAETHNQFMAEQKIVPVEPESILQREIGLVALHNDIVVGYAGAINVNTEYTQIGTLVVPEHKQGSGIGKHLVKGITELVTEDDMHAYAFCNPNSMNSFENAGYTPALPGELPAAAQSSFDNQPMVYLRQMSIEYNPSLKTLELV